MDAVAQCAPQAARSDLQHAFENVYARRAKYPQFKRKGSDERFRLTGSITVGESRHIQLPRIGKIRAREKTDTFRGRILPATAKREADRWDVALRVELNREAPMRNQSGVVGRDGKRAALVATDAIAPLPKPLAQNLRLLRARRRRLRRMAPLDAAGANPVGMRAASCHTKGGTLVLQHRSSPALSVETNADEHALSAHRDLTGRYTTRRRRCALERLGDGAADAPPPHGAAAQARRPPGKPPSPFGTRSRGTERAPRLANRAACRDATSMAGCAGAAACAPSPTFVPMVSVRRFWITRISTMPLSALGVPSWCALDCRVPRPMRA